MLVQYGVGPYAYETYSIGVRYSSSLCLKLAISKLRMKAWNAFLVKVAVSANWKCSRGPQDKRKVMEKVGKNKEKVEKVMNFG